MSLRHRNLNSQTKEMILGVYNYFEKEAEEGILKMNQIQLRTIEATNSSFTTLRRILTQAKSKEKPVFRGPPKKRKGKKRITGINDLDKCLIRRRVHKFHIDKDCPTIAKLQQIMRSDINYKGSQSSIRLILKDLGFKWKRKKTTLLIEDHQIKLDRINYLEKIKKYREENRTLIYTSELCLQLANKNSIDEECVVVVHAGSEAGFLQNALLIFSYATSSDDCHNSMDCDKYQNWLQNQLIPNLPPKSVVLFDNATYHNKELHPAPNVHSKKCDMEAWLADKRIPFTPGMLKPQLYELIDLNKDSYRKYEIDLILSEHGHDVLRLPVNQQDLNPMELAWVGIKGYISSQNAKGNAKQVIAQAKNKIGLMGDDVWKTLCDKVKEYEEYYRKSDFMMEQLSEDLDSNEQDKSSSDEVLLCDELITQNRDTKG